ISTVGSYVTPSYELSVANKLVDYFILILTALFGVTGFTVGVVTSFLYLVNIKALQTPYFWPLLPFNLEAILNDIFRIPIPYTNRRPSIVRPKNIYSQPIHKNDE